MKKFFVIFCVLLWATTVSAQRVGLVMSGGGARGIAHLGVIKALEEHGIPIDYVAGTSMGAVVAGMYASGATPDEIIEILKSDDFKRWSTGEIEEKFTFFYKHIDRNPAIIGLRFDIDLSHGIDSLHIIPQLPSNVISPVQMNYAFVELFMKPNAIANGDFDNLFVPFRSVAADVFNKEVVVLRKGHFGDAIRASMTFPFVYQPISIDDRLLFDGGIYNNFPVDVMRNDFAPDFMIGSVVGRNHTQPSENPFQQLQAMIVGYTDYSIPEDEGIVFHFGLERYTTFDFAKVDELVEIGYNRAIRRIDEIKNRVERRVSPEDLAERRAEFRARFPKPLFQNIYITGVDSLQQIFISRSFNRRDGEIFTLADFETGYFSLTADERIKDVHPRTKFNKETGYFDLHLHIKLEAPFQLQLGGNISTSTSNQAFLGLQYQRLSKYSHTSRMEAQFGRIYNGLSLSSRIDMPFRNAVYARGNFLVHKFDYFAGNRFFYQDDRIAELTENETFIKLNLGIPLTKKGSFEFGGGYGFLRDHYLQSRQAQQLNLTTERSSYSIGSAFAQVKSNTLNSIMYPTSGQKIDVSVQGLYGIEFYRSTQIDDHDTKIGNDLWFQFSASDQRFFNFSPRWILGTYGAMTVSTRSFSHNYTATVIQAPAFTPTPHSRTVFNDAYRANQFVALGLKPIFRISNTFILQNETYVFLPYRTIERDENNKAYYSEPFNPKGIQFISELSLVLDIRRMASISAFLNYYSDASNQWNVGVNVGILLFNEKFLK